MPEKIKKMNPRALDSSRRKGLAITVAVLVVILAVVLGILVFSGGGNKGERGIVAQESEGDSTGTQEGDTAAPADTSVTIDQVEVPPLSINRRRNPFKPLLDQKSTLSCEITAEPVEPLGGGVVTVPPELERSSSGEPPRTEVVSTVVTLEDIFEEDEILFARVRVAEQLFDKVAVGDTFAEYYKLLALGRESGATLLFGDERFTFFVGQSIYW